MPEETRTPTARGTTVRAIRIETDLWERFGELADPDRSGVIREFLRWYTGEKGAKMPRRPRPSTTPDGNDAS